MTIRSAAQNPAYDRPRLGRTRSASVAWWITLQFPAPINAGTLPVAFDRPAAEGCAPPLPASIDGNLDGLPEDLEEVRSGLMQRKLLRQPLTATEAAQLEQLNALVERSLPPTPRFFEELRLTTAELRRMLEDRRRGTPHVS